MTDGDLLWFWKVGSTAGYAFSLTIAWREI